MQAGEFTCPSYEAFSPLMLSPMDLQVDSHTSLTRMSVHLRQIKTDQFGAGTIIHLGRTGSPLCPVTAMLGLRPPSCLYIKMAQVHSLREVLRAAGVEDSGFSGHSFLIRSNTGRSERFANPDTGVMEVVSIHLVHSNPLAAPDIHIPLVGGPP